MNQIKYFPSLDIWEVIIRHLTLCDYIHLSRTCRQLSELWMNDDRRRRLIKLFTCVHPCEESLFRDAKKVTVNGILHCEYGPAMIDKLDLQSGSFVHCTQWYRQGRLHSYNDLPAVIQKSAMSEHKDELVQEEWCKDGKRHRENGPALIMYSQYVLGLTGEYWYYEGKLHRIGGPAVITSRGRYEYWIHGVKQNSPSEKAAI